jgi:hypothetical protein
VLHGSVGIHRTGISCSRRRSRSRR